MTDSVAFFRNAVAQVTAFVNDFEALKLLSDKIGADSSLSGKAATAAGAQGRNDLATADFDNLKAAIDAVTTFLNGTSPGVNAASVKLPFYKIV